MWSILIIIAVLVVIIPVGFLMSTSLGAAVLGGLLTRHAEEVDPDSELIATNR